jgi:plasmid stabilization system protein ParE
MAEIVWTKLATEQLERAVKYVLAEQGLFYASIVYKEIIEKVDSLETHPLIGQKEPLLKHKKSGYRYVIAWSYKIIYRVEANKVVISRVFHTARNPSKIFVK